MSLVIASLMSLAAVQAAEESDLKVYDHLANWMIYKSTKDAVCVMETSYQKGDVMIHWQPRKKTGAIFTYFKDFAAIKEDQTYKVKVSFLKGKNALDDGWGERDATGIATDDGVKGLMTLFKGDVFLDDLAQSSLVALWYKDEILASYDLTDSSKVIAAMRRCSADILKVKPIDPFEG